MHRDCALMEQMQQGCRSQIPYRCHTSKDAPNRFGIPRNFKNVSFRALEVYFLSLLFATIFNFFGISTIFGVFNVFGLSIFCQGSIILGPETLVLNHFFDFSTTRVFMSRHVDSHFFPIFSAIFNYFCQLSFEFHNIRL